MKSVRIKLTGSRLMISRIPSHCGSMVSPITCLALCMSSSGPGVRVLPSGMNLLKVRVVKVRFAPERNKAEHFGLNLFAKYVRGVEKN
jgi:hypothetical protein